MIPALPTLSQTPSPNQSSRNGQRVRLIVVHDTESDSIAGTVSWFAQKVSQVSAHLVMAHDGSHVVQMVPFEAKAWAVCSFNGVSISIEGVGVETEGYSDAWWQAMANIVAWLLRAYGLECRWAHGGNGDGFCQHADLGADGGGHVDATRDAAKWLWFCGLVEASYASFGLSPLPAWALHGNVAPMAVSAPPVPPAAWTPSPHESAVRSDGDFGRWPVGSFGWVQGKLGVTADGLNGPVTQAAIKAFQASHGLAADGIVGQLTIAALGSA